jgi:glycosyltransferase involved in cell wall biosynthesis
MNWRGRYREDEHQRLRVLFLLPRLHTNLTGLLNGLTAENIDVHVLVIGRGKSESWPKVNVELIKEGKLSRILTKIFKVRTEPSERSRYFIPQVTNYYKQLQAIKPHYVVARGLTAPYILLALLLLNRQVKLILYTQGAKHKKRSLREKCRNAILGQVTQNRWMTPVNSLYNPNGVTGANEKAMTFVPFAISLQDKATVASQSNDTLRIISVGKFEPRKNHKMLVEVLSEIAQDWQLTIVGEVSTRNHEKNYNELHDIVQKKKLTERVTLIANVEPEKVRSLLPKHHIFVLISEKEPASISQLEAMAAGLGVIIGSDNGTATYVRHKENGLILNAKHDEVKDALQFALTNRQLVAKWSNNSKKLVEKYHSIEKVTSSFLAMLDKRKDVSKRKDS